MQVTASAILYHAAESNENRVQSDFLRYFALDDPARFSQYLHNMQDFVSR